MRSPRIVADPTPRVPWDPEPEKPLTPTSTAKGGLRGEAVVATIGPEGESLITNDGRFQVDVPAGALDDDTEIRIESLENHAYGGLGDSYRLLPAELAVHAPLSLSFYYTDADVIGSSPEFLGFAFQTEERFWKWAGTPEVDHETKSIRIETSQPADYALVRSVEMKPSEFSFHGYGWGRFSLVSCYPLDMQIASVTFGDPSYTQYGYPCANVSERTLLRPKARWALIPPPGGEREFGGLFIPEHELDQAVNKDIPPPRPIRVDGHVGTYVEYSSEGPLSGPLSFAVRAQVLPVESKELIAPIHVLAEAP